jgi:membrane-associated protein
MTWAEILETFKHYIDPQTIVKFGLPALAGVVFAETGLFFGFFFPGDSLLFTAGLLTALPDSGLNIWVLLLTLYGAGIAGNQVGYWFGKNLGSRLYQREDTFFFKKKHLDTASKFYTDNGSKALIIGRFLPIIRTFAPIVAGMIRMEPGKFFLYNVIGCFLWVTSMTLAGYALGNAFGDDILSYLHYIIIGLIFVTLIPVVRTWWKSRNAPANHKEIS